MTDPSNRAIEDSVFIQRVFMMMDSSFVGYRSIHYNGEKAINNLYEVLGSSLPSRNEITHYELVHYGDFITRIVIAIPNHEDEGKAVKVQFAVAMTLIAYNARDKQEALFCGKPVLECPYYKKMIAENEDF